MDGWKIADLVIASMDLVAVSLLTIGHRFKPDRRVLNSMLFGTRLGLSVVFLFLLIISEKIRYPTWVSDASFALLQLSTSVAEWIIPLKLAQNLPRRIAEILKWTHWMLVILKAMYALISLSRWLSIPVSVIHITEDTIFLITYLCLRQRGAWVVFVLMSGFQTVRLLVAISSFIISLMPRYCSAPVHTLLYGHLFFQTLSLAGILFKLLYRRHNQRIYPTNGMARTKGSTTLVSVKVSESCTRSGFVEASLPSRLPLSPKEADKSHEIGFIVERAPAVIKEEVQIKDKGENDGTEHIETDTDYQLSSDGKLRDVLEQEAAVGLSRPK